MLLNQGVAFKELPSKASGEPRQSSTGLEVMAVGGGRERGLGGEGGIENQREGGSDWWEWGRAGWEYEGWKG